MRLIDTSGITASKGYPLLANNPNAVVGIDFIQAGLKELFAKCAQSVSLSGNATILEGMALSGSNISAGGMYFNGEIFIYNGGSIAGSPNTFIACSWIPAPTDTSPNKTVLSDGSQVSVHNQRTLTFTYSATPNTGNLPDYGTWVQNQVSQNTAALNVLSPASWVGMNGGYTNSWSDFGTPFNAGRFRREGDWLTLSGVIAGGASGTICFTLSPGWVPLKKCTVSIGYYFSGNVFDGYITIDAAGNITVFYQNTATYVSLDGVRIPLS